MCEIVSEAKPTTKKLILVSKSELILEKRKNKIPIEIVKRMVIGNVFKINSLKDNFNLIFSIIKCLIECKKQKYIKKETNG